MTKKQIQEWERKESDYFQTPEGKEEACKAVHASVYEALYNQLHASVNEAYQANINNLYQLRDGETLDDVTVTIRIHKTGFNVTFLYRDGAESQAFVSCPTNLT